MKADKSLALLALLLAAPAYAQSSITVFPAATTQ